MKIFLNVIAITLLILGGFGFVAESGLIEKIIPVKWEWPMGKVRGCGSDGEKIYCPGPAGFLQVYDQNLKYLTRWYFESGGGLFKMRVLPAQVEVVTARGDRQYLFRSSDGVLTSDGTYKDESYWQNFPEDTREYDIPTPFYLLPFSTKPKSWGVFAVGLALFAVTNRKLRKKFSFLSG